MVLISGAVTIRTYFVRGTGVFPSTWAVDSLDVEVIEIIKDLVTESLNNSPPCPLDCHPDLFFRFWMSLIHPVDENKGPLRTHRISILP